MPHLAEMCSKYSHSLKGIFYTCKLGEKLWRKPAQLLDTLERVKEDLGTLTLALTLILPLTPNP